MSDEVAIYFKDAIKQITTCTINANGCLIDAKQQKIRANYTVIGMKQGYINFTLFTIGFNRCLLEFISKKLEPMNSWLASIKGKLVPRF